MSTIAPPAPTHAPTRHTLAQLQAADEDFEWYPTTDEMIQVVADDIRESGGYSRNTDGILDIGAGDCRVLKGLAEQLSAPYQSGPELFAIEKSMTHLSAMPKDVTVVGTEFFEQILVDKRISHYFSNPPYSQFESWTAKLIAEAACDYAYLIIPVRWRDSDEISHALNRRDAEFKSLGHFDFENAERQARARVEILRVEFSGRNSAFNQAIEDMLPELEVFDREPKQEELNPADACKACRMIEGDESLIKALVHAYDTELAELLDNYRAVARLSLPVLKELDVTKENLMKGIREKIKGLKDKYWRALFGELGDIKQRLATKQREQFLSSLKDKTGVDFTENNILSMLIWITKWANDFFDEQLIDFFRTLSRESNIERYKSNQRTWQDGDWRYCRHHGEDRSHYKLEYRLVLYQGGICTSQYNWRKEQCRGLTEQAYDFLNDVVTIANNLGFACEDGPGNYDWVSGRKNTFLLDNGEPLVAVKAYKNGNLHLQFNQKVILAINVEAGRLLGWLRDASEAAEELQVPEEQVAPLFKSQFRIGSTGQLLLTSSTQVERAER